MKVAGIQIKIALAPCRNTQSIKAMEALKMLASMGKKR